MICLILVFKVKGLFKMTSPLPLSITQCNKIYILSPPYSELWVTKRRQSDDARIKRFELQTVRKQSSNYYNTYNKKEVCALLFQLWILSECAKVTLRIANY